MPLAAKAWGQLKPEAINGLISELMQFMSANFLLPYSYAEYKFPSGFQMQVAKRELWKQQIEYAVSSE